MLLALTLAYVVPFELLLFAYVVLGPAHYATEISWLHDRKYFVPHHAVALALAAVAILIAFIDSASWSGFIIWSTLVVCALIVIAKSGVQVMLLLAGAAALTFIMYLNAPWLGVIGILLPTLIHVSLFTLISRRSCSSSLRHRRRRPPSRYLPPQRKPISATSRRR